MKIGRTFGLVPLLKKLVLKIVGSVLLVLF